MKKLIFASYFCVFISSLIADSCDPSLFDALYNKALFYERVEGNKTKAIEIYKDLYICNPKNPDVLFQLGRLLSQTGQWNEAENLLKKCIVLAPQYADAALQLGNLYLWQGRLNEAEVIYKSYPNNLDAMEGLVKVYYYKSSKSWKAA